MKQTLTLHITPTPCAKEDYPQNGETVLAVTKNGNVYPAEYAYSFRRHHFQIPSLNTTAYDTDIYGFAKIPETI